MKHHTHGFRMIFSPFSYNKLDFSVYCLEIAAVFKHPRKVSYIVGVKLISEIQVCQILTVIEHIVHCGDIRGVKVLP